MGSIFMAFVSGCLKCYRETCPEAVPKSLGNPKKYTQWDIMVYFTSQVIGTVFLQLYHFISGMLLGIGLETPLLGLLAL